MKRTLVFLLLAISLNAIADSQVKLGIINSQEILEKSRQGKDIYAKLESMKKQKTAQVNSQMDEIKDLEKELASPALNNEVRERKSNDLQAKRTEFKRLIEDAQRDLQRESQKALMELEEKLTPLINEYGRTNGFTTIYDRARSGIVYFDTAIDITADIIREVDARSGQ